MILLATHHLRGAPPRLDPPVVLPGGAVDLRLRGESGSNYTVEASVDLINWLSISNGIAINGLLAVRHEAGVNRPSIFYRAREAASTLPPLTVGPQLDTNLTVSTLLTSAGGSALLYGLGGTRFTFSQPTNSVPEPTVLKLTLVTNITGLPFASGMRGAVRIEPDDLAFWGPGTLEITFPPGIDRRYLASFFCNADGTSFQLTPDRVGTNTITITITRPGIFGSSVITAQELADVARREIGESPVPARATHLHAAAAECPFGADLLADQMRRTLTAARSANANAAAAALIAARQAQPADATSDSPSAENEVVEAICKFYQDHIAPKWFQAIQNCEVGKVVLEFALTANRQRQLLDAGACADAAEIPTCVILQTCLREIRECCENGTKGSKKVTAVRNLERQQQLIALNCISREEAQDVIEICSSNIWTGSFSMFGNGFTSTTVTSAGTTTTTIDKYTTLFDGQVEESIEEGTSSTGFGIQLRVFGQLSYITLHSEESSAACFSRLQSTEEVAIGPTEYLVQIAIPPDGSVYTMYAFHIGFANQTSPVHGTRARRDYERLAICNPPVVERDTTRYEPTQAFGVGTPAYQGTLTIPINAIADTISANDPDSTPPTTFIFDWSFTRREAPQ